MEDSHVKDEAHDPSRCPSPRTEKTVPKDASSMPTSREREGTAGPKALTNNPIKKKDRNMASEGATRFISRAGVIAAFLRN